MTPGRSQNKAVQPLKRKRPAVPVVPVQSQTQVLDRIVSVLRVLAEHTEAARLRDVVEGTGLSPSTARRLLLALASHDLCEQTREGRYRLGLGLFEFGMKVRAGFDLSERARPVLEDLAQRSELTGFLCIRRGDRAVCLDRVNGLRAFTLALTPGGSVPLHVGGAGLALLIGESDAEIRAYVDRLTPSTGMDANRLLRRIRTFRGLGYTFTDEDLPTQGVAALGAPVYAHGSIKRPIAAISVAGLGPHVSGARQPTVVAALLAAARRLSRELGSDVPGAEDLSDPGSIEPGVA